VPVLHLAAASSSHHWFISSGQGMLPALDECFGGWVTKTRLGDGCVGRPNFKPITGLCLRFAHSKVTSKADHMEKKYLPLWKFLYTGFQKPY
jgi:hypothetical protein